MPENKKCPTKLLSDAPLSIDELGGAHARLASAIADFIQKEEGGITIGIEGSWGSGKSTVANLLQNILASNHGKDKYVTVYFDAWAHEGDPLRRTILEKLIDQFIDIKLIKNRERWEKEKRELSGKSTQTETQTTPLLTRLGKILIFLTVVFVPIGISFLSEGIKRSLTPVPSIDLPFSGYFLIGLVLIILPFLLVLISQLAILFNFKILIKFLQLHHNDPWSIFIQKYETHTITSSLQTPNPTSVEFERLFVDLVKDVLENNTAHKIVLILDNLDRVTPHDALSIISTLQTFLQCIEQEVVFKRLWTVIPYDPTGIRNLWMKEGIIEQEENCRLPTSMIDKLFQTRFRVPPLILSNWRDYFIGLLSNAFPQNHNQSEFYSVYKIYLLTVVGENSPTPREMKLFINQMGTIHRQWTDDIFHLSHIAYFISLLNNPENNNEILAEKIRKGDIPESNISNSLAACRRT